MDICDKLRMYLPAGGCAFLALSVAVGVTDAAGSPSGVAEFKKYCAACHAGGGNIINPDKTLSKTDREKNGIKTAKDIIRIMRKPSGGMPAFDENALPEKDAQTIAEYIINTFK